MDCGIAQQAVLIRRGENALLDVSMRVVDLDADSARDLFVQRWDNVVAPAEAFSVQVAMPDTLWWRMFFTARNGSWHQDLILKRSDQDGCW